MVRKLDYIYISSNKTTYDEIKSRVVFFREVLFPKKYIKYSYINNILKISVRGKFKKNIIIIQGHDKAVLEYLYNVKFYKRVFLISCINEEMILNEGIKNKYKAIYIPKNLTAEYKFLKYYDKEQFSLGFEPTEIELDLYGKRSNDIYENLICDFRKVELKNGKRIN